MKNYQRHFLSALILICFSFFCYSSGEEVDNTVPNEFSNSSELGTVLGWEYPSYNGNWETGMSKISIDDCIAYWGAPDKISEGSSTNMGPLFLLEWDNLLVAGKSGTIISFSNPRGSDIDDMNDFDGQFHCTDCYVKAKECP